ILLLFLQIVCDLCRSDIFFSFFYFITLLLLCQVTEQALRDTEYIWEFKLTNKSDKPQYNVSITDVFRKADESKEYKSDTAEYKILILPDGTELFIDKNGNVEVVLAALGKKYDLSKFNNIKTNGFTLEPGESLIGRFVYNFDPTAEKQTQN
ncbi:MAG: hypothetical protein LBM93_14620, partial [Oscillospiraceae bacterium]|nr:hypothetical protein [Oscillospiraceae bacterium]